MAYKNIGQIERSNQREHHKKGKFRVTTKFLIISQILVYPE